MDLDTSVELTIADVVAATSLTAHTLRYYERIGLLDPVARVAGGQRRYDARDLAWISFLQRLRATGMPIRDMKRFAELRRAGPVSVAERLALLDQHRGDVLDRIADLQENLRALTDKITYYKELEADENDH